MDIVERLRGAWADYEGAGSLCNEAAAEIERLRAELLEQARIIGMSGERELALRAEVERLRSYARKSDEVLFYLRVERGSVPAYAVREMEAAHAALTETSHDRS